MFSPCTPVPEPNKRSNHPQLAQLSSHSRSNVRTRRFLRHPPPPLRPNSPLFIPACVCPAASRAGARPASRAPPLVPGAGNHAPLPASPFPSAGTSEGRSGPRRQPRPRLPPLPAEAGGCRRGGRPCRRLLPEQERSSADRQRLPVLRCALGEANRPPGRGRDAGKPCAEGGRAITRLMSFPSAFV